ncbi:MAG: hypothetical protein KF726_10030 [Anaerolineae bacterium]|nr:hypothetical protein [Anaerolineae bacterium]
MSDTRYSERLTIGFTRDQVRRVDEIIRVRSRKGDPLTKADVVRDAVEFYFLHQDDLPGSRKAIARALEGRLSEMNTRVQNIDDKLSNFLEWLKERIGR